MQQNRLLMSWKEIASFLGKGVRTVQRWERDLGLPVHRPKGNSKGVVCVSQEELQRWLATRWSPRSSLREPANGATGEGTAVWGMHRELLLRLHLVDELRTNVRALMETCKRLSQTPRPSLWSDSRQAAGRFCNDHQPAPTTLRAVHSSATSPRAPAISKHEKPLVSSRGIIWNR